MLSKNVPYVICGACFTTCLPCICVNGEETPFIPDETVTVDTNDYVLSFNILYLYHIDLAARAPR